MSRSTTRWAMVGAGSMAVNIAGDFQLTENVELTVLVARSPAKGRAFAAEWNIPTVVTAADAVWSNPDIDAVYVATPHPSHFELSRAALLAGKHVLVEKPMTMTAAQARELTDIARAAGLFLMEAMWTRFNPTVRRVLEIVAAGGIGEVRSVQAGFGFPFPYDPQSRLWKAELGGGTVLDQGIYPLTVAYLLLGRPSTIAATGAFAETGVDCEASVLLGFPGGEQALLASSMTTYLNMTASIGGTRGRIEIDAPFWCATGYHRSSPTDAAGEHVDLPVEGRGYVPMLRAVSQAILDGRIEHDLHPNREAIEVLEILEEILRQLGPPNGAAAR